MFYKLSVLLYTDIKMKKCVIQIKDEVNCKIVGLELPERKALMNKFSYEVPGARFLPSVKLGRWNGKISYFQLGGSSYINLLPEIIEYLDQCGYDIELDDSREYKTSFTFNQVTETSFSDKTWPKGHPLEGQSIHLRDYQIEIVNNFLANPQCLQEIATGAGKCRTFDSNLTVNFNEESDFGKFLLNKYKK